MAVKISDLLDLPIYKENVTIFQNAGVDNLVRYITVMEAPDFHISSLSKDVLILTTLSSHHDSIEDINQIIESLCQAGVSAIMIKLGRYINEIDQSTIKLTNKYNVPLLALNSKTYFTNVLNDSFTIIFDDRQGLINNINELNDELMKAIISDKTIKNLLKIIDNRLGSRSYLFDYDENVVVRADNGEEEISKVLDLIHKLKSIRNRKDDIPFQQADNLIAYVLESEHDIVGYYCLVFDNAEEHPLTMNMQSITRLISIKLHQMNVEANVKRQLVSSLVDEILFTEHKDESIIVDRLKMLHFKAIDKHFIMMLKPDEKMNMSSTLSIIQNVFKEKLESTFAFIQDDQFIALGSTSDKISDNKLMSIIEDCYNLINSRLEGNIRMSCSATTHHLINMPNCYQQAKMAMKFGLGDSEQNIVYFYEKYIEIGLISYSLDSNTSEIFFKRIINPILEYDNEYNSELWKTLEECFKCDSLNDAAKKMNIHISTLRYRLSKIEMLTSYSFIENDSRMTLYLAYLLHRASIK